MKDTGQGIDPEILPKLFSQFASKSHRGTGLGLFICKSIIEAHGGIIWAENNTDTKGAAFYFSLPFVRIDQKTGTKRRTTKTKPPNAFALRFSENDNKNKLVAITHITHKQLKA